MACDERERRNVPFSGPLPGAAIPLREWARTFVSSFIHSLVDLLYLDDPSVSFGHPDTLSSPLVEASSFDANLSFPPQVIFTGSQDEVVKLVGAGLVDVGFVQTGANSRP